MHGCGILVVRKLLSSDTSYMEPIIDVSTDRFDILGVKVEDLVMVNVYLHVVRDNNFSVVLEMWSRSSRPHSSTTRAQ